MGFLGLMLVDTSFIESSSLDSALQVVPNCLTSALLASFLFVTIYQFVTDLRPE